jgi:hypothetical protein
VDELIGISRERSGCPARQVDFSVSSVSEVIMKIAKYFSIVIISICLCFGAAGEERREPIPMKELTDPLSRFYVPYPYPKTRKEIIANLKSHQERYLALLKKIKRKLPKSENSLSNILAGKSKYRIGKIVKVSNRKANIPYDYSWLIFVVDKDDKVFFRITMEASGIVLGTASIGPCNPEERGYKTEQEVLFILSNCIERPLTKNDVKQMERVAFSSFIGDQSAPLWEVVLVDGSTYYYSIIMDSVYKLEKKVPWKKDKTGEREDPQNFVPTANEYLMDTLNDEVLILKKL